MYYILVQYGVVFAGSIKELRKKLYDCPEIFSDEKVLALAREWAESNSWTFEYILLN